MSLQPSASSALFERGPAHRETLRQLGPDLGKAGSTLPQAPTLKLTRQKGGLLLKPAATLRSDRRKIDEGAEATGFNRFSSKNPRVLMVPDIELDADDEKAIAQISDFFVLGDEYTAGGAAACLLKVIESYPERETVILDALQKVLEEIFDSQEKKEQFYAELAEVVIYEKGIFLICKFYKSNIEKACENKKANDKKITEMTHLINRIFIRQDNTQLPKSLSKFFEIDLKDERTTTLFRNNSLAIQLGGRCILYYLETELIKLLDPLKTIKNDFYKDVKGLTKKIIKVIKKSKEIPSITKEVAKTIRNHFFHQDANIKSNEIEDCVSIAIRNMLFLRAISPFLIKISPPDLKELSEDEGRKRTEEFRIALSNRVALSVFIQHLANRTTYEVAEGQLPEVTRQRKALNQSLKSLQQGFDRDINRLY